MNKDRLDRIRSWLETVPQLGYMPDGTGYVLGVYVDGSVGPMSIAEARAAIELPGAVKMLLAQLGAPPQFENLVALYSAAKDEPDNTQKALDYFKALAEARLNDYYKLQDELTTQKLANSKIAATRDDYEQNLGSLDHTNKALIAGLETILDIANTFADGHDEINEHTPEAYINLLEGYLTRIGQMAKRGAQGRFPVED